MTYNNPRLLKVPGTRGGESVEKLGFLERPRRGILLGNNGFDGTEWPLDSKRAVEDIYCPFRFRTIVVVDLIKKFSLGRNHCKAMGETTRHKQLTAIFGRELHGNMPAESRRTATEIHNHIDNRAIHHPHQLGLRTAPGLVMQSTHDSTPRHRLVFLHEVHRADMALELTGTEGLGEIAAAVAMAFYIYYPYSRQGCLCEFHRRWLGIGTKLLLLYRTVLKKNMNIVLFDQPEVWADMLPLTYTRPLADIRVGIDTIAGKWQASLPGDYSFLPAEDYLLEKYPCAVANDDEDALFIAGHILPDAALTEAVGRLQPGQQLCASDSTVIARRGAPDGETLIWDNEYKAIQRPYNIFMLAGYGIASDFARITAGRKSAPLSATNTVVGDPSLVFIEEGAKVECAIINVTGGPVYVGANAEIMEGSLLRGPVALCEHAVVNMGARIYGATVVGPYCKVGGEINNVVFLGYSNKAHDGYLGNAVIGQWCNLGAGCVASNLKNNYTPVKLWSYPARRFVPTGLQFCGLIMADHSKAGINTMFNTGTVIGVGVNIHQAGFPRAFVASFSDGGSSSGFTDVPLASFLDTAARVMARRGVELTEADCRMFAKIKAAAEQYK